MDGLARHGERRAALVGLAAGFGLLLVGSLPQVLTGILAAPMQAEIGFGESGLGLAIAAFWGTLTVAGPILGRRADRWGWATAGIVGISISAVSLAILATLTTTYAWLVIGLAVGGIGLALASPSSNLAIVHEVPAQSQGQAFGIKQSAMPAVALLGGLSVPLIAVTLGWRWVFALSLLLFPIMLLITTPSALRQHRSRRPVDVMQTDVMPTEQWEPAEHVAASPSVPRVSLIALTAILGLGTLTLSALTAFGMLTLVQSGLGFGTAGFIVALASAFALVTRVLAGWWIDRSAQVSLRPVAALLGASMMGLLLLSTGAIPLVIVGIAIGFAAAWGWPPIFILFTVRSHAHAPGRSTGITAIGAGVGSMSGPLIFGAVAGAVSFAAAWWVTTIFTLAAAVLTLAVQRRAANAAQASS